MLRERDWGEYDLASWAVRRERFKLEEARRKRESLFWAPPGGESLAQVMQRVDNLLLFMNRRFDGKRIIATCHGELMWAFRIRFERLTQRRYMQMEREALLSEKMHNGQVLCYSRRCPTTGELFSDFRFTRSVCPWDLALSGSPEWRPLQPERESGLFDNQSLWEAIDAHPRLYNNVTAETTNCRPDTLDADGQALAIRVDASHAAGCDAGALHALSASPASTGAEPPPRVLLLTKTARWRHIAHARSTSLRGAMQKTDAIADADELEQACVAHERAVGALRASLSAHGFDVTELAERGASRHECAAGFAFVCAAGGDGTLLRASSLVPDGKPLLGVNTDPTRSVGALCAHTLGAASLHAEAMNLAKALSERRYDIVPRPRMRATVHNSLLPPCHAMNEMFIGEADPSRPLQLLLATDDGADADAPPPPPQLMQRFRSSGIIVSTQIGMTAWLRSAVALTAEQATAVLRAAGLAPDAVCSLDAQQLALDATEQLLSHGEGMGEGMVQWHVREPVREPVRELAGTAAREDAPESPFPPRQRQRGRLQPQSAVHGLATRVWVRPLGWGVVLCRDGLDPIRLPMGCVVSLEIERDRQLWDQQIVVRS